MKKTIKLVTCSISLSLLLAGCFGTDQGQKSSKEQDPVDRPEDQYESVLTYTGDGYTLPGGEENEEIAKEHKEEVVSATKEYLKKEYNTDVDIHNMVGNSDGVTVFYESKGPLHFYSTAIVPIDSSTKKILKGEVTTIEGEVERSIKSALYAYMWEDDFKALDDQITEVLDVHPSITGRTLESLQNVGGSGYMSPYYFVQASSTDEAIQPLYEQYLQDPDTSKETYSKLFDDSQFEPDYLLFNLNFFMKDPQDQPDKQIFNALIETVEANNELPKGRYLIDLNDNYVLIRNSESYKQNTLGQDPTKGIIKE
ncbi:hypothetical protein ANABIO32_15430 [Rossellomorea marisflavi]|uniref:DUF1672 family protein n=1 Tax=Rossellomorea marisflavi TaxID=189381 RepID=UPI0025C85A69|nr:DUF1672 family protein [Rossellomorea marisflavi]GLI83846.1 hypothetical protein ANABIO32_15430 [Rossellomorea marisflavi]